MTYEEKYKELGQELNNKAGQYLKAEEELSSDGFLDMNKYFSLKKEWQLAFNNFYGFLSLFNKSGAEPHDVFATS